MRPPPRSRTWGRRGITPVIWVRGGGTGHVSVAGLACYRLGGRSRLHRYRGRKGETKAFTWTEYRTGSLPPTVSCPAGTSCWCGTTSACICAPSPAPGLVAGVPAAGLRAGPEFG